MCRMDGASCEFRFVVHTHEREHAIWWMPSCLKVAPKAPDKMEVNP